MKKIKWSVVKKFVALSCAMVLSFCSVACDTQCAHRDANDDGRCDLCSAEFTDAKELCDDCGGMLADDGKCPACEVVVEICDVCGGALTDGKCAACEQAAKICGVCGGTLADDGKCPACEKVVETCAVCGGELTDGKCAACEQAAKTCGVCGGTLADDGKCPVCDKVVETCDACGGELTDGKCVACEQAVKTCENCGDALTAEEKCLACDAENSKDRVNPLNGKKFIFVGNSYTYYGQTVIGGSSGTLTQSKRSNDKGFFYQLCKNNGAEVSVTNWTFDGHNLRYLFSDSCGATNKSCVGENHKSYLTDRYFDYVVLQPGKSDIVDGTSAEDVAAVESMLNFFKSANPNVKFVLLVPYHCYGTIGSDLLLAKTYLNNLKTYESQGMIVSDWGGVIMDILNKKVQVPNSTLVYSKNTFVISKSAKDGYHPNMLSGYITTLMTYCAITGERARGKTYAFCNDESLKPKADSYYFDFDNFITSFYRNGATTNFDKVFASKTDMLGIQRLVEEHLQAKAYMQYNYA